MRTSIGMETKNCNSKARNQAEYVREQSKEQLETKPTHPNLSISASPLRIRTFHEFHHFRAGGYIIFVQDAEYSMFHN